MKTDFPVSFAGVVTMKATICATAVSQLMWKLFSHSVRINARLEPAP
jgi:hypothetical protein